MAEDTREYGCACVGVRERERKKTREKLGAGEKEGKDTDAVRFCNRKRERMRESVQESACKGG